MTVVRELEESAFPLSDPAIIHKRCEELIKILWRKKSEKGLALLSRLLKVPLGEIALASYGAASITSKVRVSRLGSAVESSFSWPPSTSTPRVTQVWPPSVV